jgi:hypothetical protein
VEEEEEEEEEEAAAAVTAAVTAADCRRWLPDGDLYCCVQRRSRKIAAVLNEQKPVAAVAAARQTAPRQTWAWTERGAAVAAAEAASGARGSPSATMESLSSELVPARSTLREPGLRR